MPASPTSPPLADRLGGKAGVFFDTSVWSPLDLLGLYRLVGPEQVVYASDYPYGQQPASLPDLAANRAPRRGSPMSRSKTSWRERRADRRPASRHASLRAEGSGDLSQPMSLARIHQYLSMATPLLWTRQPDRIGVLGLRSTRRTTEPTATARSSDQIRELLLAAQAMWRALPEEGDEQDRMAHTRATFRSSTSADIVAVTTTA
jgi:hypothetical protein